LVKSNENLFQGFFAEEGKLKPSLVKSSIQFELYKNYFLKEKFLG